MRNGRGWPRSMRPNGQVESRDRGEPSALSCHLRRDTDSIVPDFPSDSHGFLSRGRRMLQRIVIDRPLEVSSDVTQGIGREIAAISSINLFRLPTIRERVAIPQRRWLETTDSPSGIAGILEKIPLSAKSREVRRVPQGTGPRRAAWRSLGIRRVWAGRE